MVSSWCHSVEPCSSWLILVSVVYSGMYPAQRACHSFTSRGIHNISPRWTSGIAFVNGSTVRKYKERQYFWTTESEWVTTKCVANRIKEKDKNTNEKSVARRDQPIQTFHKLEVEKRNRIIGLYWGFF